MLIEMPLVTVGVASYNNGPYLRETLESIRLQTYPHIELIIVDDASKDDSVKIAEAWLAENPTVKGQIIRHAKNKGVCSACNDVIRQAKGDFICIIGSDDIYLTGKIDTQVNIFKQLDDRYGVIYSDVLYIDETGAVTGKTDIDETYLMKDTFERLLEDNIIPAMSVLVRKSCYDKVGLYDENLSYEDADMWLRIAKKYKFFYSDQISAKYRKHSSSVMQNRDKNIAYLESTIIMLSKNLGFSQKADLSINRKISELSEKIYYSDGKNSSRWLQQRWDNDRKLNSLLLLSMSRFGIPGNWVLKAQRLLGRL